MVDLPPTFWILEVSQPLRYPFQFILPLGYPFQFILNFIIPISHFNSFFHLVTHFNSFFHHFNSFLTSSSQYPISIHSSTWVTHFNSFLIYEFSLSTYELSKLTKLLLTYHFTIKTKKIRGCKQISST